jgi:cyclopropane fatty-acyl-phospholipid synthase-like methyltransferase
LACLVGDGVIDMELLSVIRRWHYRDQFLDPRDARTASGCALKFVVAALVDRARRSFSSRSGASDVEFARDMDRFPVALNAQHSFTGGIMPSYGLITRFPELFTVEHDWRWSGTHYQTTALEYLENFETNGAAIALILAAVYRADAHLWRRRWRLFFLATAGLVGRANGEEWGVRRYLLRPT